MAKVNESLTIQKHICWTDLTDVRLRHLFSFTLKYYFDDRWLTRLTTHPTLADDPVFIEFLEKDGDLPKSTSTSALSGAGVMRLFAKVGDTLEKITLKVDESDEVSSADRFHFLYTIPGCVFQQTLALP